MIALRRAIGSMTSEETERGSQAGGDSARDGHRFMGTSVEHSLGFGAVARQFGHRLQVDDVAAVHAHELRGVQAGLEVANAEVAKIVAVRGEDPCRVAL